jgi:chitin synthase
VKQFEYTTYLSVTKDLQLIRDPAYPPVQLMFLLKTPNCGKTNSYRWLYNAFSRMLNPEVVVHIDVGTQLAPRALLAFWEGMYNEKDLAGACGELTCATKGTWTSFLNPIFATQHFEYKVGYQLDRTFEAATGLLSVMPGAFAAHRSVKYSPIFVTPICHADFLD